MNGFLIVRSSLFLLFVIFLFSCSQEQGEMFPAINQQDEVVLLLGKYGLEKVPPQINEFKDATYLNVINDTVPGWRAYPPFPSTFNGDPQPPFEYLPEEILELTQLRELHITDLNLRTLPENIYLLENLEYLNISFNKMIIADEIPKLKKLPNLHRVDMYINKIDTVAIQKWQKENPQLKINYQ